MRNSVAQTLGRWLSAATLASVAACGGGGGNGGAPMGEGSGTPVFNGPGAGTSVFDSSGSGGSGQTGDGPRPTADATVQISTAAVQGQVLDSSTGAALSGAAVTFGAVNLSTDSSGFYSEATYPADSRLTLRATSSGFEEMFLPLPVVSGVPAVGVFKLTPQGTATAVAAGAGGTVTAADDVGRVTFAANSLESSPGVPATGSVEVRLTVQGVGTDPYAVSGDYTSSTSEPLESFGAVVLSNGSGAQLASGATAQLRIPVSTRATTRPSSANLYRLDSTTARWVQAGTATLVDAAEGAYYQGSVDRFGQWMVGAPISSPVTVTGCVRDDSGSPVANARIVAEGIGYSGLAYTLTDSGGSFTLPAKQNSSLLVTGRRGPILTNAASTTTTTTNVTLPTCLTLPSVNAATVRLTWGASPRDIDSHLREPGGAHVYYAQKGSLTTEPFASLDVDDTNGFGPEITTVRRPKAGIYRFYLHNFSETFSPGMTGSPTRVELNYGGRTVVFTPPAGEGSALYWHLFDLEIGSNCAMTLYRYNRWRADEPANPNTSTTTQVCVP